MPAGSITFEERLRAPFTKFLGLKRYRWAKDGWKGDFIRRFLNAAGTDDKPMIGSDGLNNLLIGNQAFSTTTTPVQVNLSANGKIAQVIPFFANCNDTTPLEITRIDLIYSTADGAANTAYMSKDQQNTVAGAGKTCMNGTFNLNTTTNTLQTFTDLSGPGPNFLFAQTGYPSMVLNPGEQLTLNLASAVTSLAGLMITVWVRPHTGLSIATWNRVANGDIATSTMYLNLIPGTTVRAIAVRWGTAGSDAGTVTVQVTKDTGTSAPGGGSALFAAAQSVKGTAGIAVFPALTATAANLTMAAGDRLAVLMAGTLTALADLEVTVFFSSGPRDTIVAVTSLWDVQATNRTLFISDSFWELVDAWYVGSVASASGTLQISKDMGTTAPGAGTTLLTGTVSTAGTANTPVEGTLSATKTVLCLAPGDRIGSVNAGTSTGQAGGLIALRLRRL